MPVVGAWHLISSLEVLLLEAGGCSNSLEKVSIHNGYICTTVHNSFGWESLNYHFRLSRLATMVLHSNQIHHLIIIIREQVGHGILVFWLSIHLAGTWFHSTTTSGMASTLSLAMSAVLEKVSRLPALITKSIVTWLPRLLWLPRLF